MAQIKFTTDGGGTTTVQDTGKVWQGLNAVVATSVGIGDQLGVGCGLPTRTVTAKEVIEEGP